MCLMCVCIGCVYIYRVYWVYTYTLGVLGVCTRCVHICMDVLSRGSAFDACVLGVCLYIYIYIGCTEYVWCLTSEYWVCGV